VWRCLENVNGLVGVAELWRSFLGDRFAGFSGSFLRKRPERAASYPCPNGCGCAHAIAAGDGRVAVCQCDPASCDDFVLTDADLVLWELNWSKLGRALCKALNCDARDADLGVVGVRQIGSFSSAAVPVVLVLHRGREDFGTAVAQVAARLAQRFILLAPTSRFLDGASLGILKSLGAGFRDLQSHVLLTPSGILQATKNPVELFAGLPLVRGASGETDKILQGIHREIVGVRKEFHEMRTVKERLEQMQGEKLFAFVDGIDPGSFRTLCSVLAHGDVAKASRALNISDSTLRSRMAEWKTRGPAYKVLLELVRWRKEMGRKGTVHLNEAITKGTAATTDFVGLLSDVLDEVLGMTEESWEEKADALAGLLRPYVRT